MRPKPAEPTQRLAAHAAARWASAVARVLDSQSDPRTLELWGRQIGSSRGALRGWCSTANLQAKRSLLFARLLRAVVIGKGSGYRLADLLDVADKRTLTGMLERSGLLRDGCHSLPSSAEEFIGTQQLIKDQNALHELRDLLRR